MVLSAENSKRSIAAKAWEDSLQVRVTEADRQQLGQDLTIISGHRQISVIVQLLVVQPGPLTEDLPYQAHTKKGKVRGEMATAVMEAHRAGRIRAAIGRASNFFGPDDMAVTSFAIRPALQDKPINLIGRTDLPHTFSYAADFGKLLATLGAREDALGQIWFTPSPAPVTQNDLVKMMEAELGHKIKVMAAGKTMMSLLGLFNPMMRETVEMMYEWDKPFIMDSSKAQKAFGWQGTPLKEAMHTTFAWIREDAASQK